MDADFEAPPELEEPEPDEPEDPELDDPELEDPELDELEPLELSLEPELLAGLVESLESFELLEPSLDEPLVLDFDEPSPLRLSVR